MDSRLGAVVLCGGESRRMQRDKAWLPFDGETLLARTVRLVGGAAPIANIVVVAGAEQQLPALPRGTRIVRDLAPGRGPAPALVAGLLDLPRGVEAAFVTGCDAPLLQPAAIEWMCNLCLADAATAAGHDAVIPADGGRLHPLCAAYRRACGPGVAAAVMAGILSLHEIVQAGFVRARTVTLEELRGVDPRLDSLVNCNTPAEYEAAQARRAARA